MLRHHCPNPTCPALKFPTAGFFKTEHSLQTHLGKSKTCFEYLIYNAGDDREMDAISASGPSESKDHTKSIGGDENTYDLMESESDSAIPKFHIEEFVGAGLRYPVRVGTVWEKRKSKEAPGTRPYGPFSSAAEYDFARWAIRTRQSLSSIDGLLATKFVSCNTSLLSTKQHN